MARVRAAVEMQIMVDSGSKFGDDWKLANIKKTAVIEAEKLIDKIINKSQGAIRVVGKPKILNIIFTEEL